MRYIPSSRYTLDEIAEQCRCAVNRASEFTVTPAPLDYDEVYKYFRDEFQRYIECEYDEEELIAA
jgi:hypothetical protein